MRTTTVLPHQSQSCRRHRGRKLAEELDYGRQSAAALHVQSKGSRNAPHTLCRRTLLCPSGIIGSDANPDIAQAGRLRGASNELCQAKLLIAYDAQVLQVHPGPAPCYGLGGGGRFIALAKRSKRLQHGFGAPQFGCASGGHAG
jgi:hypothetical protein